MKPVKDSEYNRFEKLLRDILTVPHVRIAQMLDAEEDAKKRKTTRKSSASHRRVAQPSKLRGRPLM
jgi:hypothetical protein